jgi:integrase
VKEWRAELLADDLSPKRAGKALQVLSQILGSAVEGERLARNAATGVKPPKVQCKEMHFLDAEQVEWLAAVTETRYRPLILFAAYTGLRPCEVGRAQGRPAGSASLHRSGGRGGGRGQSPGVR